MWKGRLYWVGAGGGGGGRRVFDNRLSCRGKISPSLHRSEMDVCMCLTKGRCCTRLSRQPNAKKITLSRPPTYFNGYVCKKCECMMYYVYATEHCSERRKKDLSRSTTGRQCPHVTETGVFHFHKAGLIFWGAEFLQQSTFSLDTTHYILYTIYTSHSTIRCVYMFFGVS